MTVGRNRDGKIHTILSGTVTVPVTPYQDLRLLTVHEHRHRHSKATQAGSHHDGGLTNYDHDCWEKLRQTRKPDNGAASSQTQTHLFL